MSFCLFETVRETRAKGACVTRADVCLGMELRRLDESVGLRMSMVI